MIVNLEEYELFIRGILQQAPLCRTLQLVTALENTFEGMDQKLAIDIIFGIQQRGYVLLTPDGWAMTKGCNQRITGERTDDRLIVEDFFRLPYMDKIIRASEFNRDYIDCLWIYIDMLPDAKNLIADTFPWSIMFETEGEDSEDGKLFQVVKIPKRMETSRIEILKNLPTVTEERFRKNIQRIAVIEDPNHAWMVPHTGFTDICVLNNKEAPYYTIVERRNGKDVWK